MRCKQQVIVKTNVGNKHGHVLVFFCFCVSGAFSIDSQLLANVLSLFMANLQPLQPLQFTVNILNLLSALVGITLAPLLYIDNFLNYFFYHLCRLYTNL